jgi:hypothetical protein
MGAMGLVRWPWRAGGGSVSRPSVAPGPRSLAGLDWLVRVGATPLEPWGLVMGWGRAVRYDHARRLVAAGLVRTVPMTRGDGSLVVLTAVGATRAGYPASLGVRSLAPSTWARADACAWVSAWLQIRGYSWWSDREIARDEWWRWRGRYADHRGTVQFTHRPDLGVELTGGPAAIEVELGSRPRRRLLATLRMYADYTDGGQGPLGRVVYVCGRTDIADAVRRAACDAGLDEGRTLSVRTMDEVVAQARAATRAPL